MSGRNKYTSKEDDHLVKYIAKARPTPAGRTGNEIYKTLVENPDKWPWAKAHSWQSWRERYKTHRDDFNYKIRKWQREQGIDPNARENGVMTPSQRAPFTRAEDKLLVKFIAKYNPQMEGRNGNKLYQKLVANEEGKWNWAATHSWHSWRHRYVSKREDLDPRIDEYIPRYNIPAPSPAKRPAKRDSPERPAKRQKTNAATEPLDSQEEQLAKLVLLGFARADVPERGSTQSQHQQAVETEPAVETSGDIGQIKDTTEKPENSKRRGVDDNDEDEDEYEPPGSEDYDGEIYENGLVEEDVPQGDDGHDPENGEENESDKVDRTAESTIVHTSQHMLNERGKVVLESSTQPKQDKQVFKSPFKPVSPTSPLKPRSTHYRSDFTLTSQPRRPQEEDPFEDSKPSPERGRVVSESKKRPPALKESAFGNRLNGKRSTRAHESSTEDSDNGVNNQAEQITWPPPRTRSQRFQDDGASRMDRNDNELRAEKRRREKGKGKAIENDILELSPHVPRRPTPPSRSHYVVSAQDSPGAGSSGAMTDLVQQRTPDAPNATQPSARNSKPSKNQLVGNVSTTLLEDTSFINKPSTSRTINLRQELANKSINKSIQRSSSRISHVSVVSDEDSSMLQELGIQMAVKMFSQEFGVTETEVQELWNGLQSLQLLKEALTEMKENRERLKNKWVGNTSTLSTSGNRRSVSLSKSGAAVLALGTLSSAPASSSKRRRSSIEVTSRSLEYRPLEPQDVSTSMELDYEPLTGTRAGKYARLAKQGREDEALEREQRRVSSIALSPRRDLQQQQNLEELDVDEDGVEKIEEDVDFGLYDGHEKKDQDGGGGGGGGDDMLNGSEDSDAQKNERINKNEMKVTSSQPPLIGSRRGDDQSQDDEHSGAGFDTPAPRKPDLKGKGLSRLKDRDQKRLSDKSEEESVSIRPESPGEEGEEGVAQNIVEQWKIAVDFCSLPPPSRANVQNLRRLEEAIDEKVTIRWLEEQIARL